MRGPAKGKNKSSGIIENTSYMRLPSSFECFVVAISRVCLRCKPCKVIKRTGQTGKKKKNRRETAILIRLAANDKDHKADVAESR